MFSILSHYCSIRGYRQRPSGSGGPTPRYRRDSKQSTLPQGFAVACQEQWRLFCSQAVEHWALQGIFLMRNSNSYRASHLWISQSATQWSEGRTLTDSKATSDPTQSLKIWGLKWHLYQPSSEGDKSDGDLEAEHEELRAWYDGEWARYDHVPCVSGGALASFFDLQEEPLLNGIKFENHNTIHQCINLFTYTVLVPPNEHVGRAQMTCSRVVL